MMMEKQVELDLELDLELELELELEIELELDLELGIEKNAPYSIFYNLHSLSKLKFNYNIFQYNLGFFLFSPYL